MLSRQSSVRQLDVMFSVCAQSSCSRWCRMAAIPSLVNSFFTNFMRPYRLPDFLMNSKIPGMYESRISNPISSRLGPGCLSIAASTPSIRCLASNFNYFFFSLCCGELLRPLTDIDPLSFTCMLSFTRLRSSIMFSRTIGFYRLFASGFLRGSTDFLLYLSQFGRGCGLGGGRLSFSLKGVVYLLVGGLRVSF